MFSVNNKSLVVVHEKEFQLLPNFLFCHSVAINYLPFYHLGKLWFAMPLYLHTSRKEKG
jgi:hypothetical protein